MAGARKISMLAVLPLFVAACAAPYQSPPESAATAQIVFQGYESGMGIRIIDDPDNCASEKLVERVGPKEKRTIVVEGNTRFAFRLIQSNVGKAVRSCEIVREIFVKPGTRYVIGMNFMALIKDRCEASVSSELMAIPENPNPKNLFNREDISAKKICGSE